MKRIILPAVTVTAVSARASRYTTGSIPAGNPTGATFTGSYDQAVGVFGGLLAVAGLSKMVCRKKAA